jgi:transposase
VSATGPPWRPVPAHLCARCRPIYKTPRTPWPTSIGSNARLSLKGLELLIDRVLSEGWSLAAVAEAAGISERTASKWIAGFRVEGEDGVLDRSSAPKSSPSHTPEERVQVIAALRRLRMTGAEIAECLDMAVSTVSGILTKIGLGKLGRIGDGARRSL